jgi:hypothetical protein
MVTKAAPFHRHFKTMQEQHQPQCDCCQLVTTMKTSMAAATWEPTLRAFEWDKLHLPAERMLLTLKTPKINKLEHRFRFLPRNPITRNSLFPKPSFVLSRRTHADARREQLYQTKQSLNATQKQILFPVEKWLIHMERRKISFRRPYLQIYPSLHAFLMKQTSKLKLWISA